MTSDIVGLIESARYATAPVVGIPQPGQRPFCVKRELLAGSLRGLTIIDAQITSLSNSRGDVPVLKLHAVGQAVKATRVFYALNMQCWDTRQLIRNWAEAQRKKRATPVVKLTAKDKYLVKLEKQLARLGEPKPYPHPLLTLLEDGRTMYQHRQERDAREQAAYAKLIAEGSLGISHRNTIGEDYAEWLRERSKRVAVQVLARQCSQGKLTTTQLYRLLAAQGFQVRKWSELNKHDRDHCVNLFGYLARLWEYCGLLIKEHSYWHFHFRPLEADELASCGPHHYAYYLQHLRDYKELQSQIAAIRQIGESEDENVGT